MVFFFPHCISSQYWYPHVVHKHPLYSDLPGRFRPVRITRGARSQYAYRKKLGTCDALHDISSLVQENLDKGFETCIVQIDFSAAFDVVNHSALVCKLKELGIGGNLLNILKIFLRNRKQSFS